MMKMFIKNRGVSTVEYMLVIAFILAAFAFFQKYIFRGISGKLHGVGDSYGYGRQYDPKRTIECLYDSRFFNVWYDGVCAEGFNCLGSDIGCLRTSVSSCSRAECTN